MKYKFSPPPENTHNLEEVLAWLINELLEVEAAMESPEVSKLNLVTQNVILPRPRTGDIVRADGTNWNPGSNEGVYEYTSGGSWSKL